MAVQHFNQVELSRRWRLSPRTLERWRFQGTGPQYLKVGGRVVYRLEDVEAYEAEQLQATGIAEEVQPTAPLRLVRARPWSA